MPTTTDQDLKELARTWIAPIISSTQRDSLASGWASFAFMPILRLLS